MWVWWVWLVLLRLSAAVACCKVRISAIWVHLRRTKYM
jgi:hypothetical protein